MSASTAVLTAGQIKSKRILYLVFATLTLLILGLIYAWSIFAKPIIAQYSEYAAMSNVVFQISMFTFCLAAPFVGAPIIKKFGAKTAILVAAVLLAGGFALTSVAAGSGIWALFLFYSVLAGSGCGIAYNAIISLINPWFPDKTGLCSGVMMMGFGVSALVFGNVANNLFGVIGWSNVFLLIAAFALVVMLLLAFVVKPAPAGLAATLGLSGNAAATADSPTQSQNILTNKPFWIYFVWGTALVSSGLAIIGSAAQGAVALDVEGFMKIEGFGALLVGLISTLNGLGRLINGALLDKFGLIAVMIIASFVSIAAMLGLAAAFALEAPLLYVIAGIVVAYSYSSVPVAAAFYSKQRFGATNFAKNLGFANCVIAASALVNILLVAVFRSLGTTLDNQVPYFATLCVFSVIGLIATFIFAKTYNNDIATIKKELS